MAARPLDVAPAGPVTLPESGWGRGWEPLAIVLFPVGAVIMAVSAVHAAALFATKGTIEWRGRTYLV